MRIDKFLWCIRVYKTRSLAAAQCKLAKVWVNGELTKPSRELKPGNEVRVRKGPLHFAYKVISFPRSRVGAKLVSTHVTDITSPEELRKLELIRLQFKNERQRGLGRPTKKDRRDIEDYKDFDFEEEE